MGWMKMGGHFYYVSFKGRRFSVFGEWLGTHTSPVVLLMAGYKCGKPEAEAYIKYVDLL